MLSLLDLYRSFGDLAGTACGDGEAEDSYSVAKLLGGDEAFYENRPFLVSDTGGFASSVGDFAIRKGPWKLIVLATPDKDPGAKRKVPIEDAVDRRLLFNLEEDPQESTNVIRENPEIAAELEELLEKVKLSGSRTL